MLHINGVLTPDECRAIREALADETVWRDGRDTAKGHARAVKENLQGDLSKPTVKGVIGKIEAALKENETFQAAAQPEKIARMALNQYGTGMSYGDHVDAAYIHDTRTDLSFTLFLSAPEEYEGGDLVIQNAGHDDAIKGPAGSLLLYPSTAVHRVEPVKSGKRLACIGWVKSRIRSREQREMLFELETALADLRAINAPAPIYTRLLNLRNNLLRHFGD